MELISTQADLLARLHAMGTAFDYERILECGYRRLIQLGDTVAHVGAHTGRHTAAFCELVGPNGFVLAFEPIPEMFHVLQGRQLGTNLRLVNATLADKARHASFVHARGTPEESALRERTYNNLTLANPERIEVDVVRLDDFLADLRSLKFVKIDMEGGEIDCLRGARGVLQKFRPYISVEYGWVAYAKYGHTKSTLFHLAQECDYVLSDLFGAICPDSETWDYVCDRASWDWFMVPQEKIAVWNGLMAA